MHTISHSVERRPRRIVKVIDVSWQLFTTVIQTFKTTRFWLHATGKTRRFFIVHARKGYVERQLSLREGGCRQCGTCCNLLFTCPSLTQSGECTVYGICRPQACKVFPIDQRDIDEIKACGSECGYRFNEAAKDSEAAVEGNDPARPVADN